LFGEGVEAALDRIKGRCSQMAYIVTHGEGFGPQPIDTLPTLEDALAHAHWLLFFEGRPNIAIQDGNGRSISGADLVACWNGEKH
jgi:hypothetical protein